MKLYLQCISFPTLTGQSSNFCVIALHIATSKYFLSVEEQWVQGKQMKAEPRLHQLEDFFTESTY